MLVRVRQTLHLNCSPCQLRESVNWNNFPKNNFEMCFKILDVFHTLNSTLIPVPKNYPSGDKYPWTQNLGPQDICHYLHIYASEKLETKFYNREA